MNIQPPTKTMENAVWKILIIDDDEDDFLITKDMLKEARGRKMDVHWANSYKKGWEELSSDHYNAVLVDYDLGLRSGIHLIREANERGYPAPLILFTGRGNYEVDVEAMEAGATLYLAKGEVNPLLLERSIRYAIELKQKEQALRRSNEALRESEARERAKVAEMDAILDAVPVIVWVTHDPMAQEVTGNHVGQEFLRVPAGQNLSKSAPQNAPRHFRVYKDGREIPPEELPLQITAATGQPIQNFEEEVVFEDGDHAYLLGNVTPLRDEQGKPAGAVAAFINITERKQMEQSLRLSEDRFYKVFNANPNAQVVSKMDNGRIEIINKSFEKLFGYQREEVLGKTSIELNLFANPEDRDEAIRRIRAEHSLRDFELDIQTKTGEIRHARLSVELVSIDSAPFMLTVIQDITERKRAEEGLKVSEAAMDAFFEASPGILNLFDQNLRYIKTDPLTPTYFGLDPQSIIGQSVHDLNPTFAEQFLAPLLERVTQSGQPELNREVPGPIPSKKGEMGLWQVSYFAVPLPEGKRGLGVIGMDITELKKAGEMRAESARQIRELARLLEVDRSRLAAVLDHLPVGVWIADQNGQLLGKNDQADRIWAGDAPLLETVSQYPAYTAWYPENGQVLRPEEYPVAKALATGQPAAPIELNIRRFDGTEGAVLVSAAPIKDQAGNLLGVVGVNLDISNQKRAEERFRQLADAMPQLVWTATADGTVDYYNQRYREYDGIAPAGQDEWTWSPVLHPEDQQPTMEAWNRAIATGEVYQIEHRVRMKDGTYCWHLSRGVPGKDGEGNVIRWYGTATNIHAQKEIEEKIRQSNQELEQFAFIASHDLQEPLRKVIMFGTGLRNLLTQTSDQAAPGSQTAPEGQAAPEGQMAPNDLVYEYLDRMQKAAERMQIMIEGLLNLSRINSRGENFTPIELNLIVDEVISDLETQIRSANAQVTRNDLPTLEADELQLRQLFQNLIGNAIKFHQPGIPPVVTLSGKINRTNKPPQVEIQIKDNGIGFDQEYSNLIFQPFQRLHGRATYEGTGLGLAICKKIVERHRGKIEARSSAGKGSIFIITLPVRQ